MKGNWKYKIMIGGCIAVIILSLGFTGWIIADLLKEKEESTNTYWFFTESKQTGREVILSNAYVYTGEEGRLHFIFENMTYEINGYMDEDFSGVADITVSGDKIIKILGKNLRESGILHSYDSDGVYLIPEESEASSENKNKTLSFLKNNGLPIYQILDGKVTQVDWNRMVVGTSQVECILEENRVCAIILRKSIPTDIRVLIKNGESIFYEELYIRTLSDNILHIVSEDMKKELKEETEYYDTSGMVLCDINGASISDIYEGSFRVKKTNDGMVLVNQLPVETYVKYVLPSEMPKYFHEEALKAQAVCARTFAYAHMSNQEYAEYGANLDDSTRYQVYHHTGRYSETDKAVDETKGEVITYNGDFITCYYFSTSGGKTNGMEVWQSETPPYIAEVISKDETSPFYQWKAYLDPEAINEKELGYLSEITINKTNDAGYVTELILHFENGKKEVSNENEIRKALGRYLNEITLYDGSIRTDLNMIPSANFTVIKNTSEEIILSGCGFGHGIGLSQYGAKEMAEDGYSYKDIIAYYYKNIGIVTY